MAELIYELRHEVQTFSSASHDTETLH